MKLTGPDSLIFPKMNANFHVFLPLFLPMQLHTWSYSNDYITYRSCLRIFRTTRSETVTGVLSLSSYGSPPIPKGSGLLHVTPSVTIFLYFWMARRDHISFTHLLSCFPSSLVCALMCVLCTTEQMMTIKLFLIIRFIYNNWACLTWFSSIF